MIARRMADGVVELDVTEEELEIFEAALRFYQDDARSRSEWCTRQAKDLSELASRQLRGKHAIGRAAGEAEHAASVLREKSERAMDLVRGIVSAIDCPSNAQSDTTSHIEEGLHGEE